MTAFKFAISATGPLSGKTTLAKHLEETFHYVRADHSLTLTESFVEDWNSKFTASDPQRITVEDVYINKDFFRPYLQKFGDTAGYNEGQGMVKFIKRTLAEWLRHKPEVDVVYDSIRTEGQAGVLKDMGFTLVQLDISEELREQRANRLGMDYAKIKAAMDARPDLEKGLARPDITFRDSADLELMSKALMTKPWIEDSYTLFGARIRYHG